MKIFPKINIVLNILPLSDSGLHPLFSRFVLAYGELYDEMEISFDTGEKFCIQGSFDFPQEKNLIFKAKEALKQKFPKLCDAFEHIRVDVQKKIPQGSGLGGGSANAAAFLLEVGQRFGIAHKDLMEIAPSLGSDVGFFVSGYESANVRGFGEVIEPFIESNHYQYEIFSPNLMCETQKVYQAFDALKHKPMLKIDLLNLSSIELLYRYSLEELNDLYLPACQIYPQLEGIRRDLGEGWFFSGSGSSFFRIKQ